LTRVFRLVRAARAAEAFSGQGAADWGGRWNPPGTPVVYAAQSLSLAILEILVHMDTEDFGDMFDHFDVDIPDHVELLAVDRNDLAGVHREGLDYPDLQEVGRQWVESGSSAGLWVPSAVTPGEHNLILNPAHPDFEVIPISEPQRFAFGTRLQPPRV